ncbi:MAG: hypothetical protein MI674_01410 [Cytophagales bacterium]|nr:hypothetical protein [Cytophagales bacterium]
MEHSSQGSGGCSGGYRSAPYNPGLTPFHVPLSYGAAAAQLQAAVQRAVDRGLPGHVLQALLRLLDSFGVTLHLTAVVPGLENYLVTSDGHVEHADRPGVALKRVMRKALLKVQLRDQWG